MASKAKTPVDRFLTKLRKRLRSRLIDESGNPLVTGVATAHGFNNGIKAALKEITDLRREERAK